MDSWLALVPSPLESGHADRFDVRQFQQAYRLRACSPRVAFTDGGGEEFDEVADGSFAEATNRLQRAEDRIRLIKDCTEVSAWSSQGQFVRRST